MQSDLPSHSPRTSMLEPPLPLRLRGIHHLSVLSLRNVLCFILLKGSIYIYLSFSFSLSFFSFPKSSSTRESEQLRTAPQTHTPAARKRAEKRGVGRETPHYDLFASLFPLCFSFFWFVASFTVLLSLAFFFPLGRTRGVNNRNIYSPKIVLCVNVIVWVSVGLGRHVAAARRARALPPRLRHPL